MCIIVDVHCHAKFYAIYKFIAFGRKFYVVFIHVLTFLLVDHFSRLVPQDKLHSLSFLQELNQIGFLGCLLLSNLHIVGQVKEQVCLD